ncbi:MAG TPA: DinB family protein [Candidatus Acidoferrales bacterium]|nr:DinB family protein [Candidatus Acidoferrales bacterium]
MDHKTFFLKYWTKEAPATRKVIGRIPQDHADYRPDPKARTAREIAWLMVREEAALVEGLEKGAFEWVEVPPPATVNDIVSEYDRRHDAIAGRLESLAPSRWEEQVPFLFNGQELMRETAYDMAWGFLLDQIHHRGQLSTYLRPMGAKVPSIYGPSADEPM